MEESRAQLNRCTVSRTSLGTISLAVKSINGLGTSRVAVQSLGRVLGTSRIHVKSLGSFIGPVGLL